MKIYKVEKEFQYRGYKCIVIGLKAGYRCGYVEIKDPKVEMINIACYDLPYEVHGGITWKKFYLPNGKEGNSLYLGFDCNHAGDSIDIDLYKELNRGKEPNYISLFGIVRDTEYFIKELKSLVDQIIKEGGD